MPERVIRLLAYPGGTTLRRIERDEWQHVPASSQAVPPEGRVIVPLALWKSRREELLACAPFVGVWLAAYPPH